MIDILLVSATFGILLFLGCPIAFILGISSLVYFLINGLPIQMTSQNIIYGVQSFPLLAVPLFILAGNLMNTGGITKRIFDLGVSLVGSFKGGLAQVNVLASMVFAGMSGTAVADAAGLGVVEIEAMKKRNYNLDFSAAVTIASSTIGPIIPPSVVLIVYGIAAEQSIGRLFLGGLIPGIIIGLFLMLWIYLVADKIGLPRERRRNLKYIFKTFIRALPSLFAPIIILGGIVTGIVTPTEAGGIAVIYSIFLGIIYKELNLKKLTKELLETAKMTGVIMFVVAMASIFGWALTRMQVPLLFTQTVTSLTSNKILVLLLIDAVLLILGTFMETISIMMIIIPVLVPLAISVGIDLVHLGVVSVYALMIGTMTPPYGICLYIASSITKLPIERIMKAVIPFFIPLLISLIIITIFPQTVTFLPNILIGK